MAPTEAVEGRTLAVGAALSALSTCWLGRTRQTTELLEYFRAERDWKTVSTRGTHFLPNPGSMEAG